MQLTVAMIWVEMPGFTGLLPLLSGDVQYTGSGV
jgi:hypothetical protein